MVQILLPKLGVKPNAARLCSSNAQRSAIGAIGKLQQCVQMFGSVSIKRFRRAAERSVIGFRSGLKSRIAVLRRVFHELNIADLDLHSLLADIPELVPETIKPPAFGLVEHEPREGSHRRDDRGET